MDLNPTHPINGKQILVFLLGTVLTHTLSLNGATQFGSLDAYIDSHLDFAYDSNLFLRETDKLADSMFLLYAGAVFSQSDRAVLNMEADVGVEIIKMDSFSSEDAEDFKSNFTLSYPNNIERNSYFEISTGFNENSQSNADIGQRIQVDTFHLEARFEQAVSGKVGMELSGGTQDEKYYDGDDPVDNQALDRDSDILNFGLAGTYQYSEKLVGLLQYTRRDLDYNDQFPIQQDANIVAVGFRGEISPKVNGSVSVGLQDVSLESVFTGNESHTDPFYSVDLEWTPRDKTTVTLYGDNNFQTSVYGDANNREMIGLSVNERLSDKSSMFVGIQFSDGEYQGLLDRSYTANVLSAGYAFIIDEATDFNVHLTYEDRNSSLDELGFSRFLGSIGVSRVW